MADRPLLIIWHSRTGASEAMAGAAAEGAGDSATLIEAEKANAERILAAQGYLFVCPENLASMSGMMKDMFDRTYYDVLGRVEGRPYATIIAAGSDGEGAERGAVVGPLTGDDLVAVGVALGDVVVPGELER